MHRALPTSSDDSIAEHGSVGTLGVEMFVLFVCSAPWRVGADFGIKSRRLARTYYVIMRHGQVHVVDNGDAGVHGNGGNKVDGGGYDY